jgi:hypothetical protein
MPEALLEILRGGLERRKKKQFTKETGKRESRNKRKSGSKKTQDTKK